MKTLHQIADRCRVTFDAREREVLLQYLPFDLAHPFLAGDATEGTWNRPETPHAPGRPRALQRPRVLNAMQAELRQTWKSALAHRAHLVGEGLLHLRAYAWILELDDLTTGLDSDRWSFAPFGGPILFAFGTAIGSTPTLQWPQRMSEGKPCTDGCPACGAQIAITIEGV